MTGLLSKVQLELSMHAAAVLPSDMIWLMHATALDQHIDYPLRGDKEPLLGKRIKIPNSIHLFVSGLGAWFLLHWNHLWDTWLTRS